MQIPGHVLEQFGVRGEPTLLSGGSGPVFRVGDAVFKRLHSGSLEHDRSVDLAPWLAEVLASVPQVGFRIPRPLQTRSGLWLTDEGWTAWTHVQGRPATVNDVPDCLPSIVAFHRALRQVPRHPLLDRNDSVYGRADVACWGGELASVRAEVEPLVERLRALRRPVEGLDKQLIHGDLNPGNILVARGLPPAFVDLAPFWRPAEFALALFANWIGPRQRDASVLRHFAEVRHFNQLLIRAGIRMLLIMTRLDHFESRPEAGAAQMILEHVSRNGAART